jgi:hypothetical protein
MLVVAVLVHVSAMLLHGAPPGALWLLFPGIALIQGLLLLIAGTAARDRQ